MRKRRSHFPAPPSGSGWKNWLQLLFLVMVLLGVLVVMGRLGDSSAGCFMLLTDDGGAQVVTDTVAPQTKVLPSN